MANQQAIRKPQTQQQRADEQAMAEHLVMHQEMLSKALRFYWGNLKDSFEARRYLKERGVTADSVRRFGLGFAGSASQSLKTVFPNYHVPALVDSGLVVAVEGGHRRYDRFRNRIIFPILSESGRVIAFGGRLLAGEGAKYLNSPQSALFDKGATLFGLRQARSSIEEQGEVIVVEGYMDVVMSAQHGINNTVATLGTATTSAHVRKLMSTPARRIVFCFDGDGAGVNAAVKAMEACIEVVTATSAEVAFAFLSETEDPDSFIRNKGADVFREFVSKAVPFETFLIDQLRSGKDLTTCEGRAHMTHEAFEVLARVQDAGLYYRLCEAVSVDTNLSVSEVIDLSGSAGQRSWHSAKEATHTECSAIQGESDNKGALQMA